MANKNDTSDLAEFFIVSGAIIVGFFALAIYGYSLIDKKYIRYADAKISGFFEYAECQLNSSEPYKKTELAYGGAFFESESLINKMDFSVISRCPAK